MTTVTIRGTDSQKAMDEVLRRLGPDALILSTRLVDGMVEMQASTGDAMPPTQTAPKAEGRADHVTQFADVFRAETQRPYSSDPLAALGRKLLMPDGLAEEWPARLVIVGPPGGGKSMLAARLCARLLRSDPACRPVLVAPVPGTLLVEDRLRGWARLMGQPLDRPSVQGTHALPAPHPDRPQIIDLSDVAGSAPDLAARLIDDDGAELILCLPAGLHPAHVARYCRDWQAFQPTVALTRLDLWWPEQDELTAIADHGLKLTRTATGTGLIDALSRPDMADLRTWAAGWSPTYAGAAE